MNEHFEKVARNWIEESLGSGHPVRKLVEKLDSEIDALRATVKRLQDAYLPGNWEKLDEIIKERDQARAATLRMEHAAQDARAESIRLREALEIIRVECDPEINDRFRRMGEMRTIAINALKGVEAQAVEYPHCLDDHSRYPTCSASANSEKGE